jgi:hypothetical protein
MERAGSLAFVEVGLRAPNAYTQPFEDGSYLVVVTSGLIDFMFAVVQTLYGGAIVRAKGESEVKGGQKIEGVAEQLAALYGAWRSGTIWGDGQLPSPNFGLPERIAEQADRLTMMAVQFVLAHELGHVAQFIADASEEVGKSILTREDELQADAEATRLLFKCGPTWSSIRMSLAGAMVAVRILTGLERLGHRFPGDHPSPEERLMGLWMVIRNLSESEPRYWYDTTMAYAFDELLEAAENVALGQDWTTTLTAERTFSRLCAVLEEDVKGRHSREVTLSAIKRDFNRVPTNILQTVANTAARVLRPLRPPCVAGGGMLVRHEVATLFWEIMPKLPKDSRAIFVRARKQGKRKEKKHDIYWLP